MIHNLKPYPEYKDSGLPWLGTMPEHWERRNLRVLLKRVNERNRPDLPLLSVVREQGVIQRDTTSKDDNHNIIPDDLSNYKVVRAGQFAMNKMKAWQGSYGVSKYEGIVSPAYYIFGISGVEGDFFHSAIRSRCYIPFFTQASDGIRVDQWDLSQARMKEIPFYIPPLSEQKAIVRFLDHADRRIKRYIRAKQKLIKLLNEQKQAIIHQAVTRGLDPNVRLKPSGVEWLGDIPEHWEVRRLKSLSNYVTSGSRGWGNFYADDGPIFLRIGNISTTSIDLKLHDIQRVKLPPGAEGQRTRVEKDDILISITALIGAVGIIPANLGEAYVNQHTALVKPIKGSCFPRWLAYCLISSVGKKQCQVMTNGGTKEGLGLDDVKNLKVILPPAEEQVELVALIDHRVNKIIHRIENVQNQIDLIQEYRTRLIADVVTGKLDVRAAAARLPEEYDEWEFDEDLNERNEVDIIKEDIIASMDED